MFTYYEDSNIPICPYPEKRNHLSFVNISPTLVIDTSMERFSRVLQHEKTKIRFYQEKTCLTECSFIIQYMNIQVGLNIYVLTA